MPAVPEIAGCLTVLGASARAAAASARRAGISVSAGDLFGDVDLAACCPSVRVSNYPEGLLDVLRAAPPGPWMYTGALENHPRLIERMAVERPLLGNGGGCLRRVRDPAALFRALDRRGLPVPPVAETPDALPTDGSWLIKPRRSAGGQGVAAWRGHGPAGPQFYFQRRIAGQACGAVYLAAGGRAVLLGATQQLLGTDAAGGDSGRDDFRYSGSIGPVRLQPALAASLARLGETLAADFSLSGLFGIDVIVADWAVWPVEVNPRYTASVEVLERALGQSLVAWHVRVCSGQKLPPAADLPATSDNPVVWGKRILFARRELEIGPAAAACFLEAIAQAGESPLADIPPAGSRIARGRPILTVFARGASAGQVESSLAERAAEIERLLGG